MGLFLLGLLVALGTYMLAVRRLRYEHRDSMLRKYAHKYAANGEEAKRTGKPRLSDERNGLQGIHDAQRIMRTFTMYDLAFTSFVSLQFALFVTYASPTISGLLQKTGQLSERENAPRRYVDTASLIASYLAYPLPPLDLEDNSQKHPDDEGLFEPQDPRGAIAIARTNWLHNRWRSAISRDDMLFTLCTFVQEPEKWAKAYEWRPLEDIEVEAAFAVWRHIGRCFGITDIPESREALAEWREQYESTNMIFAESNRYVADKTADLLLWNVPKFFHPFAMQVIVSLMYEQLRVAMGYDKPPAWVYSFTTSVLRLRSAFVKNFMLPRKLPKSLVPYDHSKDYFIESPTMLPAVCPASGARASEGRTCPVGGHAMSEKSNGAAPTATGPRMTTTWYDNEPIYSIPARPFSTRWCYERLFVSPKERWGAAKWRSKVLTAGPVQPVPGLGGFRLEELGPIGLERKGIEDVKKEAERLNGGRPLKGAWAIQA
ncbi:hypothetical protein CF327_g3548 [Tilletia walkeri]|uniref:ER-bound oxygenase mpaB/mpaB'/Rubber oxygenase catalytic domain-containing protein n=1 Tax=Tilletia walkeri TaxID=117179 RepID=A0A8X7NC84_9BASI|nr:hypothetical protein CF327_g3548 [Tilletia walkeri]KAE8270589.1 hypothetical protein A4X09_0g1754 [Tilletia walkeri]